MRPLESISYCLGVAKWTWFCNSCSLFQSSARGINHMMHAKMIWRVAPPQCVHKVWWSYFS